MQLQMALSRQVLCVVFFVYGLCCVCHFCVFVCHYVSSFVCLCVRGYMLAQVVSFCLCQQRLRVHALLCVHLCTTVYTYLPVFHGVNFVDKSSELHTQSCMVTDLHFMSVFHDVMHPLRVCHFRFSLRGGLCRNPLCASSHKERER